MPPKKAAAARKPRAPKAYKLPDPLPEGEILRDVFKRDWRLGKPIGTGGFGLIYLASSDTSKTVSQNAEYVIKIEPHSNGPLFCELAFYQRVAKPDMIEEWKSKRKLKVLGVPKFIGTGSHECRGTRYRFMVMERFGEDLQKIFERNGKRFPHKTVLLLGIRLLDALEYLHNREYVHADVKASNILMGFAKGATDQVFLVDYGLAFRYICDGKHKEYKEDPRKAHDGTIEFTSRDAHRGVVPSRRADLEILGYCLLQWLCSQLPWENNLNNKEYVRDQKIKYMNDIPGLMKACFPSGKYPGELVKYFEYVVKLKYDQDPDYSHLKNLLTGSLKKMGGGVNDKLDFETRGASPVKKGRKRLSDGELNNSPPLKQSRAKAVAKSKPRASPAKKRANVSTSNSPAKKRANRSPSNSPPRKQSKALLKSNTPKASPSTSRIDTPKSSAKKRPIKSPLSSSPRVRASPARKTPVNSPGVSPRQASAARTNKSKQIHKKAVAMASAATQTSPGLRGLRPKKKR